MSGTRESRKTKTPKVGTKIDPLPGDLNARMVRCGKSNCRCSTGKLHGPYYVRRWRVHRERHSMYVKKQDVAGVKTAVLTYRCQQKRFRRELSDALKTLRGLRSILLNSLL